MKFQGKSEDGNLKVEVTIPETPEGWHWMSLAEAEAIARATVELDHPPTNPAVLLRAMTTLYKEYGWCEMTGHILDWMVEMGLVVPRFGR
jgi:hypothetical protein